VFFWVSWLPPAAPIEVRPPAARAVAFAVQLPKAPPPAPPRPPPPPPPPELVKLQVPPEAPVPTPKPKQAPRAASPKPAGTPAPLALSSVKDGAGSVVVQRNETDVLGDPAVAVTAESLRGSVGAQLPAPPAAEPPAPLQPPSQPPPPPVAAVLVRAVPQSSCPVRWPEGLVMDRRTFAVRLLLTIDRDGHVMTAKVLRGAGAPFDQAAIDALRQCLFQPGTRDGLPVVDRVPFLVEFKPSDV